MKKYPALKEKDHKNVVETIEFITRERVVDVRDWDNLTQRFLLARKVARIPTSSADVIDGDVVGDMNWDAAYLYVLVDNAGSGVWRRAALGSW